MPLASGTALGPYTIESPLGAGGMGEVYKATDTRLDRTVAIKVLPEHVAADPDLKQRFEREAKTVAALSHPHICSVFDVGEQDGVNFLVMEYLDGETLAQRLTNGALPLDHALQIAIEIADALDKAHRQGIVHRDLKPGNIMLTKTGAKLLDFGLAKLRKPGTVGAIDFSAATTQNEPLTERGTILGTLQYMSPEQVEGKDADARADIFACGAVLYEMITGQKAFSGESQASLIGAILRDDPAPVTALTPEAPHPLAQLVATCLAKDPALRWQTAADLSRVLDWARTPGGMTEPLPLATAPSRGPGIGVVAAAVMAMATAVAVWWVVGQSQPPVAPVMRATIAMPFGQTLDIGGGSDPLAISADGNRIAYVASSGGLEQLYLRQLDSFDVSVVTGTEGARYPFFSPDGLQVAFFADGQLKRVSVDGENPTRICDVDNVGRGGSWGPDDTIVFVAGSSGLMRVDATGGTPEPLISGDPVIEAKRHTWPRFVPDGRAVISSINDLGELPELAVLALDTGEWHRLGPGTQGQYLPSGHLVYHAGAGAEGELHAVAFDLDQLAVRGAPVSLLDGIFRASNGGAAYFAVADNGALVFAPGGLGHTLVRVDRDGRREPLSDDRRGFRFPRLSPDGGRVAVTIDPRPSQIWVYDIERQSRIPLTSERHNIAPVWTSDGRRVAYRSVGDISWRAADGSTEEEPLLVKPRAQSPDSWSPDGQSLVFMEQHPSNGWDLWMMSVRSEPEPLIATSANEMNARLSPDGRWLAYHSDESGRAEIYVRPFPDVNERRWTVSVRGGISPVWSPDGRELFYMNGADVMAVSVDNDEGTFTAGTPERLFDGPFDTTQDDNFDISPDGTRFVMIEADPDARPSRFQFVLNWHEELKERVPVP